MLIRNMEVFWSRHKYLALKLLKHYLNKKDISCRYIYFHLFITCVAI